jgi:hypothetical protein
LTMILIGTLPSAIQLRLAMYRGEGGTATAFDDAAVRARTKRAVWRQGDGGSAALLASMGQSVLADGCTQSHGRSGAPISSRRLVRRSALSPCPKYRQAAYPAKRPRANLSAPSPTTQTK